MLDQERKDQEALHMLKYLEKLQVEDLKVNLSAVSGVCFNLTS